MTDSANHTDVILADEYPVTDSEIGGGSLSFGVTTNPTGTQFRDRDSSVDARLAGSWGVGNGGTEDFRINLDETSFDFSCAVGDTANASENRLQVIDGNSSSVLLDIEASTAANEYMNAAGSVITEANWPKDGVTDSLTATGASPYILIRVGSHSGGTNRTRLAHVLIETTSSGVNLNLLDNNAGL